MTRNENGSHITVPDEPDYDSYDVQTQKELLRFDRIASYHKIRKNMEALGKVPVIISVADEESAIGEFNDTGRAFIASFDDGTLIQIMEPGHRNLKSSVTDVIYAEDCILNRNEELVTLLESTGIFPGKMHSLDVCYSFASVMTRPDTFRDRLAHDGNTLTIHVPIIINGVHPFLISFMPSTMKSENSGFYIMNPEVHEPILSMIMIFDREDREDRNGN